MSSIFLIPSDSVIKPCPICPGLVKRKRPRFRWVRRYTTIVERTMTQMASVCGARSRHCTATFVYAPTPPTAHTLSILFLNVQRIDAHILDVVYSHSAHTLTHTAPTSHLCHCAFDYRCVPPYPSKTGTFSLY